MQLFKSRLKRQWNVYLTFFKSIADWITYIYLIIPLTAFTFYLLKETVLKVEYGLIERLHPAIVVFILIYIGTSLVNRTFSEPADKLFLIQNTQKYAALKRWSYYYSLVCNLVVMAVLLLLVYPLFRYVYDFTSIQCMQFALSMIGCYLIGKMLLLLSSKWVQNLTVFLFVGIMSIVVFYSSIWSVIISSIVCLLSMLVYEKVAIQSHRYFEKQTKADVEAYYRWHSRIFFINPELKTMKLPVHKGKAPIFFKQAKSKNNVSVLSELILKTIFRNKKYLWNVLRLISIVLPLILIFPWWGAYLLVLFMYFGLKSYLNAVFFEIKDHAIFKIISTEDINWLKAFKKVERYISNSISFVYIVIITCRLLFF